ncbi:aminotransferase class III-fold pyridoxal phosphate-dependent enzyme [bacterium]|jgi:glutamate-1-semialdehyde 2,1-aminomutase|nr:aminotransferase class III-fold pyridoxal phosphate-dependent enzyme [bacterium]
MGKSQNLYKKAKKIIPGGTQLLSKRPEMFLPNLWPSYYNKSKGCEVWDLDGKHYYDIGIMGIGTCVLGYANDAVNDAVKNSIDNGSMSTLNAPEEVELAEKMLEIHTWAGHVRFAKTGGEAVTIALRIARAHTQKTKIAFCGYHGWHDWYLSANLNDDDGLGSQLLPGLSTDGIPKELKNTAFPFNYGNYEKFDEIIGNFGDELGVVIMEVQRYKSLDIDFLKHIRKITTDLGIVLIFDEISSGFRVNIGGMHLLHGVNPDMAVFGKALGNGFPISAILGNETVMSSAQNTFISSSYWTERTGYVAALKTLEFYEEKNVIQIISKTGMYIRKGLSDIFDKTKLNISVSGGLDSVVAMDIQEENPLLLKTIFIQEMLDRGFLASNLIYVSFAHTHDIIDKYLENALEVFQLIASHKDNLKVLLKSEICHSGFQRLN